MMMGPEPMSRIFFRSVRLGMAGRRSRADGWGANSQHLMERRRTGHPFDSANTARARGGVRPFRRGGEVGTGAYHLPGISPTPFVRRRPMRYRLFPALVGVGFLSAAAAGQEAV